MPSSMSDGDGKALDPLAGFVVQTAFGGRRPEDLEGEIRELGANGIVLFKRDLTGGEEAISRKISLIRGIVRSSPGAGDIEPLIAIDQEGGYVARLEQIASPSAMAFGAAGDARLTEHSAHCVGSYLRALGINWNLAPVLDVAYNHLNPVVATRSFGGDPALVAEHGLAFIRGMRSAHVMSCAKHFPGHGRTAVDSHLDLPVIDATEDDLLRTDMLPYTNAIKGGVGSVMAGHMYFRNIQKDDMPSCLSPDVVDGLLRGKLGYDGLVVTDALEMHAVSNRFSIGEAAVLSIKAGCDIVMTTGIDQAYEAATAIGDAVRKGGLRKERLQLSRKRILAAMDSVRLQEDKRSRYEKATFESLEGAARESFLTASQLSVTVVGGFVPPAGDGRIAIVSFRGRRTAASDPPADLFEREAGRLFNVAFSTKIDAASLDQPDGGREMADGLIGSIRAAGAATIIVCTREAHAQPPQLEIAGQLGRSGLRTVAVGLGTPFEAASLARAGVPEYLCCYSLTAESVRAAVQALAGHFTPRGISPVTLA